MTERSSKDLKGVTRSEIVVPSSMAPSHISFEIRFAAIIEALREIKEKIEKEQRRHKLSWSSPKNCEGGLFMISVRTPNGRISRVLEFWVLGDHLIALSAEFIEKQSGKSDWNIDDHLDLIPRLQMFLGV